MVFLHRTGQYPAEIPSLNLDAEWFYRCVWPRAYQVLVIMIGAIQLAAKRLINFKPGLLHQTVVRSHGREGVSARGWLTGSIVLWVAVVLGVYLVLKYI